MEEEEQLDVTNKVIVLPEDEKIEPVIDCYIYRTNYFVEYLHFNNNGRLDGFIDHKSNMYMTNIKQGSRFVTVCLTSSKQWILFGQINLILIWQPVCSNKCADICQRAVMTQKRSKCLMIFTLKRYSGVVLVTNLII